jgi:hypothetical protein
MRSVAALTRARALVPLALVALAGGACQSRPQVWLVPNVGSPDMAALFARPEEWAEARQEVTVFAFYSDQVRSAEKCAFCGPNTLANLAAVRAFTKLRLWHIQTAVSVNAIKPGDCAAEAALSEADRVVANIAAAGGRVSYLDMDEPLLSGLECGQPLEETVDHAARFMATLQRAYPEVWVGDTEPYPHFRAATLEAWLDGLISGGQRPAFFHLDVDRRRAQRLGVDVGGDLLRLDTFCQTHGIPFGIIIWSDEGGTDEAYYRDALQWVETVRGAMGQPEQLLFQSWVISPDGQLRVPTNLPDNDPAVFSHTRLLLDSLQAFRTRRP